MIYNKIDMEFIFDLVVWVWVAQCLHITLPTY